MEAGKALAAAACIGALALAGCVGQTADPLDRAAADASLVGPVSTHLLEDPEGDATDWNSEAVLNNWGRCSAVGLGGVCRQAIQGATAGLPTLGGVPAPPAFDVLSVDFAETPESLEVAVTVVELPEDMASLFEDRAGAAWGACWGWTNGSDVGECVYYAAGLQNGVLDAYTAYDIYDSACNDWWWCTWQVPYALEAGAPGVLRLTIPRSILAHREQGDVLDGVFGETSSNHRPTRDLPQVMWRVTGPASTGGNFYPFFFYSADDTAPTSYTMALPRAERADDGPARVADYEGETGADYTDLLSIEQLETPSEVVLAAQVARVSDPPEDHEYYVAMGLDSGRVFEAGYVASGGTIEPYAGYCSDPECDRWVTYEVAIERVPGTPGWINVTFDRRDLGEPGAGTLRNILMPFTGKGVETTALPAGPFELALSKRDRTADDLIAPPEPYWFRLGTDAPIEVRPGGGFVFEDPAGDVTPPRTLPLEGANAAQFDLTYLEAEAVQPGLTRLTLGVDDLSSVAVPLGYDAVLYATGLGTAEGAFMAAYYKENSERGGRQEFFCAQDTVVLDADARRDPNEVVWQAIEGFVSVSRVPQEQGGQGPSGGSGGSGSAITFLVPHSCLGLRDARALEVQELGAGSFLVQNPTGRSANVEALDTTEGEPVVLAAAPAPLAPEAAWYVSPFGVENFWDITGVLAAGLVATTGAVLVKGRRGRLRDYLTEVDRAAERHQDNARARKEALLGIRERLKGDVMRSRVSEGHFALVDRRIEEHLLRARAARLAETFPDLPHALLVRLEEMLQDDRLTPEEYRAFCKLLDHAGLSAATRASLKQRLRLWVDASR